MNQSQKETGSNGPMPAVDPADLKAAWQVYREAQARRPCDHIALSNNVLAQRCSKNADVNAIAYRLGFLRRIVTRPEIFRFLTEGQPNDAVIRAFARIPMSGPESAPGPQGFPFEMRELLLLCRE
jgi:hypothetical protein